MLKNIIRWGCAALTGVLAACAIITVNVYFPEKDVKQAYKSLDEMLLKQGGESTPQPPAEKKEEVKPQSSLHLPLSVQLIGTAEAAESVADTLAVEISDMPEVLKAYAEMKGRLPELNALRDSGAVGENRQGLITIRDKVKTAGREELVKAENENRKTVITGMAKAILKVNKRPANEAGIKQVLPQAAATYAATRHDAARPGWWIQLANERWVQK
jgi:hypothetical protein